MICSWIHMFGNIIDLFTTWRIWQIPSKIFDEFLSVHQYIYIIIYISILKKGAVWDSSLGTLVLTSTTSLTDKVRVRQCQPCEVVHWTREQRRTVRAFGDVWPPPAALFEVLCRHHLDTGLFHSLKIGYLKILVMKNPSFSLFHGRKLRYPTFSDPQIWLTSNLTHAHPSIFGHISFRCGIVIPIYPSIHPSIIHIQVYIYISI